MINLPFSNMSLDRCASQRKSHQWIDTKASSPDSEFLLHYRGKFAVCNAFNLIKISSTVQQKIVSNNALAPIYLGENENSSLFVADLSALSKDTLALELTRDHVFNNSLQWIDVRESAHRLLPDWLPILGFAKQLCHWHRTHQFCGFCGTKLESVEGGHAKKCTSQSCQQLVFPRTDPVVIMLVEHTDEEGVRRCLLAGHQRTGGHVVSTLAGFVDPGESLEEAVIREVKEEVGLDAKSVNYICSQPWPFPASVMVGFRVTVESDDLSIDKDELTHAQWCTAQDVLSFDDWSGPADDQNTSKLPQGTQIPSKLSIARYLIDSWCEEIDG